MMVFFMVQLSVSEAEGIGRRRKRAGRNKVSGRRAAGGVRWCYLRSMESCSSDGGCGSTSAGSASAAGTGIEGADGCSRDSAWIAALKTSLCKGTHGVAIPVPGSVGLPQGIAGAGSALRLPESGSPAARSECIPDAEYSADAMFPDMEVCGMPIGALPIATACMPTNPSSNTATASTRNTGWSPVPVLIRFLLVIGSLPSIGCLPVAVGVRRRVRIQAVPRLSIPRFSRTSWKFRRG